MADVLAEIVDIVGNEEGNTVKTTSAVPDLLYKSQSNLQLSDEHVNSGSQDGPFPRLSAGYSNAAAGIISVQITAPTLSNHKGTKRVYAMCRCMLSN